MSSRIVTVTANPALDVSTTVARIEPDEKLRGRGSRIDPGGGGVNVSRLVHRLGGATLAIVALGGVEGDAYRRLLEEEGVPFAAVPIAEETRQNFAVHEEATGRHFRFVLEGPVITAEEWAAILGAARRALRPGDWLVSSGSMPPGAPEDAVAQLVRLAHETGARAVVDSSGAALAAALEASPELIKPSRRELEELVGRPLPDDAAVQAAAAGLVAERGVGTVVVTLGADGAMLVSADGTVRLPAVDIVPVSTVGAGDSFLAGLVLRLAQGRPLADALRTALAAGAATAAGAGTRLASPEEVARLEAGRPRRAIDGSSRPRESEGIRDAPGREVRDVMGIDDIVEKAKDLAEGAAERIKDVAGDAKELAGDAVENVKELAGDAAENVKEFADDAVDKAKDVLGVDEKPQGSSSPPASQTPPSGGA